MATGRGRNHSPPLAELVVVPTLVTYKNNVPAYKHETFTDLQLCAVSKQHICHLLLITMHRTCMYIPWAVQHVS